MTPGTIEAIAALLTQAESAHGDYEATELNGVYDEAWADWYARYAVQYGIGDLLGQPITAEQLAKLLASAFDAFRSLKGSSADSWAIYVARRIATTT